MEITHHPRPDHLELRLIGRLDANWADHVGGVLEAAVRAGSHHIRVNLARVEFLSSAGIRVLLKYYQQLKSVNGKFHLVHPSEGALSIIKLSGLEVLLIAEDAAPTPPAAATGARLTERGGVVFEVYEQNPGAVLNGSLVGQPEKFSLGQFVEADCHRLAFAGGAIGLGLGAFGKGFADCRGRFGEFVAVAGTAVTLPTDGSSVPDFVIAEGQLVPEVNALYALTAAGPFSHLLRFEAKAADSGVVAFAELVAAALEISGANTAGLVILAESAALVGAALRQSPGKADGTSPLTFPLVRDWLSFTTERRTERNLALIVGFAEKNPLPEVAPFLRPIGPDATLQGHFHAAVFPYRPVQKGNLELGHAVKGLLGTDSAQTVMHLLADDREFEGVGQTELMRGACWVGPIKRLGAVPK